LTERPNNFDLKLLTASKEVGLRRLRSYSASLGGGAQIFCTYDELRRHLNTEVPNNVLSIVLHDHSIALSPTQLNALQQQARVFLLRRPDDQGFDLVPPATAPCWGVESFMQCSLTTFLDSPVVRMSMAQLCKTGAPFHMAQLLRWGHAAHEAADQASIADASLAFVRSLNLTGEGRRLIEMFSHFLQVSLIKLKLEKKAVTFGSDGLLTMVVARCLVLPGMHVQAVAAELKMHDFPIGVINRLAGDAIEIAALYYPCQPPPSQAERIVMVFNKSVVDAVQALAVTQRAG